MPYCFHCNKEVKDLYECPKCGRELLPDVNFVDHDKTQEEMFLNEIRRKKLREVYERDKNIIEDFGVKNKRKKSIPINYTSVRPNPKYREKE